MIRFNCPNCNRFYEVPPALAFLPLLCKQCGQRITPPAPTPDPPPPPPAPLPPTKPALPVAKIVAPPPAKKSPLQPADKDESILVPKPDSSPDIDFNIGGPTTASPSGASRSRAAELESAPLSASNTEPNSIPDINLDLLGPPLPPPPPKRLPKPPEPEAPPEAPPEPTLLPFVADLIVFLVLVVVGMFVGELLVKKDTGKVLSEAGSAPKFPPIDLLLWAGPPVMFALIYLLLGSRERTVGAWLRRRKSAQSQEAP